MRNSIDASLFANEYQKTTASLVEIAHYYDINYNTLKSYAKRHNWQKNKRSEMTLERLYYPDKCKKIPYRVVVVGFMVAVYNINPIAAYRFAYFSKKTTSRVNSYRLLKREDAQFIMEYGKILKDATSSYDDFVETLRPVYRGAFWDAEQAATQIRDSYSKRLEQAGLQRFYTEDSIKQYKAEDIEPETLFFQEHQGSKL